MIGGMTGLSQAEAGEVFGWVDAGVITALVLLYADGAPGHPEPAFSVMPRTGIAKTAWPSFRDADSLGPWFGEHCRAGRLACLDTPIGETTGIVYWVPADKIPNAGTGLTRSPAAPPGSSPRHPDHPPARCHQA